MRHQRGSVFVLTLAIMAGLVVLISSVALSNREATHAEWNRMQERRARIAAESGVQRAIAVLQSQNPNVASVNDPWATLGNHGSDQLTLEGESYRLEILDAGSRVNINSASQDQLKKLSLSASQVDSLLDWREEKKTARPQGAKDDFYNQLPFPYNAKLKPFDSVEEILLVKDFTPDTIYSGSSTLRSNSSSGPLIESITAESTSHDKNAQGNPKLDVNSVTADQLVAIGVPTSVANAIMQARGNLFQKFGDVFRVPQMTNDAAHALADNAWIGQDTIKKGLINVNTASESVLNTVPGLNSGIVASIVERRATGFHTLGDLVDVPGMTPTILAQCIDELCVGSRTFYARVVGIAGSSHVALEAALTLTDDGQVQMTRLTNEPYWDARKRWGWSDTTSRTIPGDGS